VRGANFVSSPSLTDSVNHFDVRLDHSFRPSDDLFARYSFVDDNLFDPFAGSSGDASVPVTVSRFQAARKTPFWARRQSLRRRWSMNCGLAFNRVSNGDFPQGREPASIANWSAGAFDESARLGIDTNLGEWFLTDRG